MAEEPLDRLLVRRTASRGVVINIFDAMESTLASMEQDPQKHPRFRILMDQLAKRTELLKALDERILQAVDINQMEPEILSAEQFLSDIYIRMALFKADYESLKPPPTLLDNSSSSTSAGFRRLKRSSTPPPRQHSSLYDESPPSSSSLPDAATLAVIGASKVSTSEPSTLVTSIINPVPDSTQGCVDDSSPSPLKTVAILLSSDSLQAEEPSDGGSHISFIADYSTKPIDLPVVEHDQVHLSAAGAATAPHPQDMPVTKLDGDQATVPDLAVHIITNSTLIHPTAEAVATAAPIKESQLPVGIYNSHHVCPARAQLARRTRLYIAPNLMEYDPALQRHPDRHAAARPIKPPPWLRRG